MSVPEEVHVRVIRLLNGEARATDFDRLFLWMRENSCGRQSVRDLGDFAAHWSEREQGLTWEHATKYFDALRAHIEVEILKNCDLDLIKRGAVAAFFLDSPESVKQNTGINKQAAQQIINKACSKITGIDYDLKIIQGNFSKKEITFLKRYIGLAPTEQVFSQDDICDDLIFVLKSHNIINDSMVNSINSQKELISAYAITKMHGAKIKYSTDELINLKMGKLDNNLMIWAEMKISVGYPGTPLFCFPIFRTTCKHQDWIHAKSRLVELENLQFNCIELEQGKICILQ